MDRTALRGTFCGNYIALPTPFDENFDLDVDPLRALVRRMLAAGFKTGNAMLLVGGAAGEFSTLEMDERKRIADVAVEEAAGRIPVVFGVQDTSTRRVVELCQYAEKIGADAVQTSPPFYEPASPDDIFELIRTIADSSSVPMIVYNTWWTGVGTDIGREQIDRLLEIPTVASLKWSSALNSGYETVLSEYAPKVPIIDNHLSEVWATMLGATGYTSHLPLAWPDWGLTLWDNLQNKRYEEATEMLRSFRIPYYELFYKALEFSGCEAHFDKTVLDLVGFPVGPPRPPGRPLPEKLRDEIRQMLISAGVPSLAESPDPVLSGQT
jgi:4-hydroxy-tetrahydrodipicolinate synthase